MKQAATLIFAALLLVAAPQFVFTQQYRRPVRTQSADNKQGQTTVVQQKQRKQKDTYDTGSFYHFGAGMGVSSLGYKLDLGSKKVRPAFNLSFGYSYFFKPFWGLKTGLEFASYGNNMKLTEPLSGILPFTDYMGEPYDHRIAFKDFTEKQRLYQLEIPFLVSFKYKPAQVGLYADMGLKLAFAVSRKYTLDNAVIKHTAYYEQWDLTIQDVPTHGFTDEELPNRHGQIRALSPINAMAHAELGMLMQVKPRFDISLGIYADITMNNADRWDNDRKEQLGFRTEANNLPMNEYHGVLGTTLSSNAHPWQVGLKLGLMFTNQLSEAQKRRHAKKMYEQWSEYLPECTAIPDTIYVPDTICVVNDIYVHDTIYVRPDTSAVQSVPLSTEAKQARQQMNDMLKETVIWFALDSYVPILEPADIIDSVAVILVEHPELRIHVNGHACKLGTDGYNRQLALKRAKAVAKLLEEKGVHKDQMIVASFGATDPFHYTGEHQLAKDRRVEIIPVGLSNKKAKK